MKYKTVELTGALLDAAVALADGMSFEVVPQKVWGDGSGITIVSASPACRVNHAYFQPSRSWADGGPIIEREKITLFHDAWWEAGMLAELSCSYGAASLEMNFKAKGETALVAAMRAFVYSRYGDTVDL